jgi:hypothetical protein
VAHRSTAQCLKWEASVPIAPSSPTVTHLQYSYPKNANRTLTCADSFGA